MPLQIFKASQVPQPALKFSDANGTNFVTLLYWALAVYVHAHIHAARGVDPDLVQVRIHVSAVDVCLHSAAAIQALYQDYVPTLIFHLLQLLNKIRS